MSLVVDADHQQRTLGVIGRGARACFERGFVDVGAERYARCRTWGRQVDRDLFCHTRRDSIITTIRTSKTSMSGVMLIDGMVSKSNPDEVTRVRRIAFIP